MNESTVLLCVGFSGGSTAIDETLEMDGFLFFFFLLLLLLLLVVVVVEGLDLFGWLSFTSELSDAALFASNNSLSLLLLSLICATCDKSNDDDTKVSISVTMLYLTCCVFKESSPYVFQETTSGR